MQSPTPLPDALRYLQPFVNSLAKLSPEDLNEDLDASRLESALRKRLRGLDEDAAEQRLAEDRGHLQRWLETQPDDHPAHWVVGYLLYPDLATHLTRPPEPPERGPQMMLEAPDGWKVKPVPFRLDLKAGKVLGSITAIDEFSFDLLQRQREPIAHHRPPDCQETTEVSDVTFGQCQGKKYLYRMIVPAQLKRVDYVLSVPGGYVTIFLGAKEAVDFDEAPLEAKLHTLRMSVSA